MSTRAVRWAAAAFFLLYAAAVTWPGAVPMNRIEPYVLGLPLSMAWISAWLALSFGVLLILDRSETRREDAAAREREIRESEGSTPGRPSASAGEPGGDA